MLTLLLAFRNTHQSVSDCLRSLRQAAAEFGTFGVEFILIDDASAPEHRISDICLSFRKAIAPAPVRVIRCRQREHYNHVLALGLSLARGELVLFISHDMVVTPDYVQTLLRVAPLDATFGVIRGTSTHVDLFPQHEYKPPFPIRIFEDVVAFSHYVARYWGLVTVEDSFLIGDSMLIKYIYG